MKQNFGNILKDLLLQVVSVMLGVYLGLIANDWQEAQKNKALVQKSLGKFRYEVTQNQQIIKEAFAYHQQLSDSIKVLLQKERPLTFKDLKFWRGMRIQKLKSATYQTAIITGVLNDLEIELLTAINDLYISQEKYDMAGNIALQGILQRDLFDEQKLRGNLIFLSTLLNDIYWIEKEITDGQKKVLESLKKEVK